MLHKPRARDRSTARGTVRIMTCIRNDAVAFWCYAHALIAYVRTERSTPSARFRKPKIRLFFLDGGGLLFRLPELEDLVGFFFRIRDSNFTNRRIRIETTRRHSYRPSLSIGWKKNWFGHNAADGDVPQKRDRSVRGIRILSSENRSEYFGVYACSRG